MAGHICECDLATGEYRERMKGMEILTIVLLLICICELYEIKETIKDIRDEMESGD